ncbi:MAG: sugar transferase [Gemmataceae bacterium]
MADPVSTPEVPAWKRAEDFILAGLFLIATSPVIVLAMVVVKLTSPGPAIHSQTRLGLNRRQLTMYKIRTMRQNCEAATGARWATKGDPRQTFVGRILRATHIDELPQLWNVLRGHMSLVGPRPERPEIVEKIPVQFSPQPLSNAEDFSPTSSRPPKLPRCDGF